jgi:hypothetical protein
LGVAIKARIQYHLFEIGCDIKRNPFGIGVIHDGHDPGFRFCPSGVLIFSHLIGIVGNPFLVCLIAAHTILVIILILHLLPVPLGVFWIVWTLLAFVHPPCFSIVPPDHSFISEFSAAFVAPPLRKRDILV